MLSKSKLWPVFCDEMLSHCLSWHYSMPSILFSSCTLPYVCYFSLLIVFLDCPMYAWSHCLQGILYTVFLELLLHLPAFLQNEVTQWHSLVVDHVNTKVFLEYFVQFLCSDMVGHINVCLKSISHSCSFHFSTGKKFYKLECLWGSIEPKFDHKIRSEFSTK